VIESIEIKNLRGIREGKLEGLTPLTILVGPNGCGKSTILEALFIGAHPDPGSAVVQAVLRRKGGTGGSRWILHRAGQVGHLSVGVTANGGQGRRFELRPVGLDRYQADQPTRFRCSVGSPDGMHTVRGRIVFPLTGAPEYDSEGVIPQVAEDVRLVEAYIGDGVTLENVFSRAVEQGDKQHAIAVLGELLPGLKDIVILLEGAAPIVHLVFTDYSVPAALGGDGIHALLRLVLELASRRMGLVLVEEPEVHQHPAAIARSARATVVAARDKLQVVLSTHSLEFIDYVLAASDEKDLERLSVFRLKLDNGGLIFSRLGGKDVAFARNQIADDLR
jgi:hypothetical protein